MKFILYTILFSICLFADSNNLEYKSAASAVTDVLDLIFLGAKFFGAIAIILGLVELLIEKDQGGQQGKKVSGSMKLMGGILLSLAASVISWMIGV